MKKVMIITILISFFSLMLSVVYAQPLPYDTAIGGGEGSFPVGGGAPLGSGLLTMLALSLGYVTTKTYRKLHSAS